LRGLHTARSAFLDEAVTSNPVAHYASPERFAREQASIFHALPVMAAHSSELAGDGAFLRREVAGLPLLLTRDGEGGVHAFLNVCRHRGARLVEARSGCKRRFSCPYHAWTYSHQGALLAVPHQAQGFPDLDRSGLGLRRAACVERFGWMWVSARADADMAIERHLDALAADFDWFDAEALHVAHMDEQDRGANWKILVEGGIEAYHFRVAHRDTIGPYFNDNLSSYETFGPHMRSVLPRAGLGELNTANRADWRLRAHANVLYTIFPADALLVQHDHVVWIHNEAVAPDRTHVRLTTLAPKDDDRDDHWRRNHAITVTTLNEDFDIGEAIQAGITTGANERLMFGRFEGALARFNETVERYLAAPG
ncbi:MAG: aromatic ring-hydroxylating dioxygenase subunit alpha, partial [Caulobacterales bacterium]|nr:aromatic ring-hydroxylating dioxygenase subunit alpha [Caulobacterales bacterium]